VRERAQLREERQDRYRRGDLRAAHQGQIAAAALQVAQRDLDRNQRGGAGGVHGVGWPHQVEPVGNAAGGDVGQLQLSAHQRQLFVAVLRVQRLQHLQRLIDHQTVLHHVEVAAVEIGSLAKDHRRALALRLVGAQALQIARVSQRIVGQLESQPLVRLAAIQADGHDPVVQRVEFSQGAEKAAFLAIDAVVGIGRGIVEDI